MVRSIYLAVGLAVGLVVVSSASAVAQDAAAGEKGFSTCRACHQIGPGAKDGIGPELNGIVGRKAGSDPTFNYSSANRASSITWTTDELDKFLTSPQVVVPHTKMMFPGVKDDQRRTDIIAYLAQFGANGTRK